MAHIRVKIIAAAAALSIALGLLALAGMNGGWVYYMSVDQFSVSVSTDQRVRLHGVVGSDNFESSSSGLLAKFDLLGEESGLRVEYEGVIPDQFRPGHDVVVEGRLGRDGVFQADTLMTKCGSRYESDGDAPHARPRGTKSEEARE